MDKKERYTRKILKQLYFGGVFSCAEISEKIDKSLPITTKILNDLVEEGSVVEKGLAQSTGGRRPTTYSLRSDVMYVMSVAMDQFVTRLSIMDMHNQFVTDIRKIELPLYNNLEALNQLIDEINKFITDSSIARKKIAGIGIGMPGFVDVTKGINYSFLYSGNKSITEEIAKRVDLPVFIDNDSSLIALAELKFGAALNERNVMVINIGWGIGLGLIVNNEMFRGNNGFAGEFSHIPLFVNGKLCSCGKTGCLETETSLLVVIEKAKEGLKSGRTSVLKPSSLEHFEQASDAIIHAASVGDRFTIELLSEAAYNIGRGVAILIHLLNPALIVLSGRGSAAGRIWQVPIQQALNEHCIPRLAANTSVQVSNLGYQAELIGAAALVMENYDRSTYIKSGSLHKVEVAMRK